MKCIHLCALLAGCQAYTNFLTNLAVYGSDAEILTALLIDLPVWGTNRRVVVNRLLDSTYWSYKYRRNYK